MEKDKFRKGIFAIAYAFDTGKIKYVILKRKKHWRGWEFIKGKIETNERKLDSVKREIKEETGLKILKVKNFGIKGKYKYDRELKDRPGIIGQSFTLYAVEVKKDEKIKIDPKEHYRGEWVDFKTALKKLTWPNQRKHLRIVDKWLKGKK